MIIAYEHRSFQSRFISAKLVMAWNHVPSCFWIYYPNISELFTTFKTNCCFAIQDFSITRGICNASLRGCCFRSLLYILLLIPTIFLEVSSHAVIVVSETLPSLRLWSTCFELSDLSSLFLHLNSYSKIAPATLSKARRLAILLFVMLMTRSYESGRLWSRSSAHSFSGVV